MKRLLLLVATISCLVGCKKQDVDCLFLWGQNSVAFFGENPYYYAAIGEPKFTVTIYKENFDVLTRVYTTKEAYKFTVSPESRYAIVAVDAEIENRYGSTTKHHGIANKVWDLSKSKTIQVTEDETMYDGDSNWLLHTYFQ